MKTLWITPTELWRLWYVYSARYRDPKERQLLTYPTQVRVGMSIGHSPDASAHKPDMRKENPSMEEKQDAKRRIEGSFAPSSRVLPSAAEFK